MLNMLKLSQIDAQKMELLGNEAKKMYNERLAS